MSTITKRYRLLSGGHGRNGVVYKADREGYPNELELTDEEAATLGKRVRLISGESLSTSPATSAGAPKLPPAASPAPPVVPAPADPPDILAGNVGQIRKAVADLEDVALLADLKAREAANEKPRGTVIAAIEERLTRLAEAG